MELADWLVRIGSLHPKAWDLGLERVAAVADGLDLTKPASRIFLVAGTNGKGSVCALIDALCRSLGLSTGMTTSPHLLRFNERIVVDGVKASDEEICRAFETIDEARGEISLTYFEFAALAALLIFRNREVDVAVLEVGLGGRLDAMNLVDPDVSVITRIALDHESWLGESRDAIAAEKAGIMRAGKPCVLGDADPPASLTDRAATLGSRLMVPGMDYGYDDGNVLRVATGATGTSDIVRFETLPVPVLPLASAAAAVQAVFSMGLGPQPNQIADCLSQTRLPGRFQVVTRSFGTMPGERTTLLDVAHNPDAASYLVTRLHELEFQHCHAVVGMYEDKDYRAVIDILSVLVHRWYFTDLAESRGASATALAGAASASGCEIGTYDKVCTAYEDAIERCAREDVILVFGSFPVVADVLDYLQVPV